MARISKMQGVPAHLEYLKKNDERRHPAKCKYAEGKGKNRVCDCTQSPIWNKNCNSAKICDFYESMG